MALGEKLLLFIYFKEIFPNFKAFFQVRLCKALSRGRIFVPKHLFISML